jgi:hypothetical protein
MQPRKVVKKKILRGGNPLVEVFKEKKKMLPGKQIGKVIIGISQGKKN